MPEYIEGPIEGVTLRPLQPYHDQRGWLIEVFRIDEIDPATMPAMMYVSETLPGIARGPHEHVDQTDTFGFLGPSTFKLYLWDSRTDSPTYLHRQSLLVGVEAPATVVIPPGVVHAYKNIGDRPGWVLNCPNRLYRGHGKREPVDEIRHEEAVNSPFVLD
jgi:dTDP-4-dehydrorhamnose 3,5-epimerase